LNFKFREIREIIKLKIIKIFHPSSDTCKGDEKIIKKEVVKA